MSEAITIPGYRIIRQLGQGGTATVYLAVQNSFGREVALKIMSPLLNADPAFAPRFTREARIVSQMHHASIVPVFDVGEHRKHYYLSMELLPGGDLRQRIVDGRCGQTLALDVCLAISSALDLAHRKGFVHRDIKPQNILFREDGTPVLTDFGIARAIDVGTSLTAAGMFVGTPNYMSPEQVKGLELDGRSDLYSLGIVLYEMLTGTAPFQADSALSIALKHLSDPLPRLPDALSAYQPFLDRLTAKDREERFANSAEVIRALSTMSDLPAAKGSTLVRQRRSADRRAPRDTLPRTVAASPAPAAALRKWLPWTGAIVLALIAGASLTLMRRTPPQLQPPPTTAASPATPGVGAATTSVTDRQPVAPTEPLPPPVTQEPPSVEQASPARPTVAPTVAAPSDAPARQSAEERRLREIDAINRKQRQIAALLADAQTSFASGAYVQPPEANAATRYRAVLDLEPRHIEALAGLQRVADALVANAERSRKAGDLDAVSEFLDQARSVSPDHPRIARLQQDLAERRLKLEQRQQANREAVSQQIAKAQAYLDREPISLRNVAEANDHYDEAVSLASAAPELPALRERILAGYATAAQTELNDKEPERAQKVVTYARKHNMSGPQLDALESVIQQQLSSR